MNKLALALCAVTLGACGMTPEKYEAMSPKFDMKEYFTGPIKAWGIVQDRSGNVVNRFDVDMVGTWEGNQGVLEEDFEYYDGTTQKRTWYLTKVDDKTYHGKADDIINTAVGNIHGNAMRFAYVMDLPVGDTTYKIKFDDWMFQMNDGVVINRSYLKKFGFTVAELTLFLQKQPQK